MPLPIFFGPRPALACAAWLTATAAMAQAPAPSAPLPTQAPRAPAEAPPTPVSPLTVEGKADPKVIEKQTHSFVRSYAAIPNPAVDQIARWHEAVCVNVLGLPNAAQAYAIRQRIEDAAETVKLPRAQPGCKANVDIVFTGQPQAMVDLIAKQRKEYLGYYANSGDREQLKTVTHPIQAWYRTVTRSEGHGAAQAFAVHLNPAGKPDYSRTPSPETEQVDEDEVVEPMVAPCAGDQGFTHCLTSEFNHVFIVADARALGGKDLASLSDYLVMLALSQTKSLDGCNVLPSVLDLLAKSPCPGRDAPNALTASDRAYLAALYASNPEALKEGEISDIAGRMAKVLIEANAGGK